VDNIVYESLKSIAKPYVSGFESFAILFAKNFKFNKNNSLLFFVLVWVVFAHGSIFYSQISVILVQKNLSGY